MSVYKNIIALVDVDRAAPFCIALAIMVWLVHSTGSSELNSEQYGKVLSSVKRGDYVADEVLQALRDDGKITVYELIQFPEGGEARRVEQMKARIAQTLDPESPAGASGGESAASISRAIQDIEALEVALSAKLAVN